MDYSMVCHEGGEKGRANPHQSANPSPAPDLRNPNLGMDPGDLCLEQGPPVLLVLPEAEDPCRR